MACNKIIKLADGRNLSFFEFGDPKGKPVFYFHGSGISTGLYSEKLGNTAAENGIYLIAPDRPGIGLSDYKPERCLLEWPKDLEELANQLNIPQFSIVSESGGSAYAYACAYLIPHRINKVAIVSGICPLYIKSLQKNLSIKHRLALFFLKRSPAWLLCKMFASLKKSIENRPEDFFSKAAQKASVIEKKLILNPELQSCYKNSIQNSFRQDYKGVIDDMRILSGNWGFDLREISCRITLWHGQEDGSAPIIMTKRVQELLKNCHAAYFPNEGHMSVIQLHAGEIFRSVI
ncbi:MAG: alpha/beta hydrolase [Clostridia bacterium]|nr:alpha/beta hydrolase [Clostridia bacterium]